MYYVYCIYITYMYTTFSFLSEFLSLALNKPCLCLILNKVFNKNALYAMYHVYCIFCVFNFISSITSPLADDDYKM